jgi:hypothetical protein
MHFAYVIAGIAELRKKSLLVGYLATLAIFPLIFTRLFIRDVAPKANFRYWLEPGPAYFLFVLMFVIVVVHFHWVVIKQYSKLRSRERNQIRYVLLASLIGFAGGITTFPLAFNVRIYPFGAFLIGSYPMIISYAIMKHRLMDISVIIRKTLVYSTVMGILIVTYLLIVTLFTRLFQGLTGYQTVFSSTVAAALITVCFQPLRKRVQAFVDRKFFRQFVDREEKLYELSREVITHTTPEAMGGALMHVLDETLHPKGGALFLKSRDGGGFTRVSSLGESVLPLRMEEDNELARYFKDHPQPFIQDMSDDIGQSLSTREKEDREVAA